MSNEEWFSTFIILCNMIGCFGCGYLIGRRDRG